MRDLSSLAESLESDFEVYRFENWTSEDYRRLNLNQCLKEYTEDQCLKLGLSEDETKIVLKNQGF